jgi:hypothetical protein
MEDEGGFVIENSDIWILYKMFGYIHTNEIEERISQT